MTANTTQAKPAATTPPAKGAAQGVRSFPKVEFTDSEAGALKFPSSTSRTYNYFTPVKLRATMYEDVTVDVQPDPERYLTQGWVYGFAKSPGGYPHDWTALKSFNWHEYRDPNEEWEQTIYRNNSAVVRQVNLCLENAKRAEAYAHWNKPWIAFIARNLGAWMHVENGLALHVFTPINRQGPTNMINTTACVAAAHKMRFAQDLALFNLDLSEADIGFDGAVHREVWQSAPEWQPTRQLVEEITAIMDWAEQLFVTNIVFEQLVGQLVRSELIMQISARNGDYVTPTLVGTGENDYSRDLAASRALFRMLARDETHGKDNIALMQSWMDKWVPPAVAAAKALQPIWSQPAEKTVTFADSYDAASAKFHHQLDEIGLSAPKEMA